MVSEVLKDLHVLGHFLFTLNLLVEFLLSKAFDCDKVTTELMLSNTDLTKGPFANLVANSIKLMSCPNWLAHFLEVCHDHGH